jgi:inosine-uridine nucleoside N-ribohydrolase
LLALGPLTNLAEALQADPDLKDRVEMVFIMGGAVDASGNLVEGGVDNAWAEWNVYIDPLAAQIVLDSGVPITLVALDATNHVPATRAFVTRLAGQAETPAAEFVVRVLEGNPWLDVVFGYYFWDPLAAGLLADETLGHYEERRLQVILTEGRRSGRLVESRSGAPVRLAVWADRERFEQALIDTYGAP